MSSSPSKSPTKCHNEMRAWAAELLASGRDHINLANHHCAASDLAEACELYAKMYGESAEECGEAYLYYGQALLEVARMENEVLGYSMQGVDMEVKETVDSETLVENPAKLNEDEKCEVEKNVHEAMNDHYKMIDMLAMIHENIDVEDSEDCSDNEMEVENDSPSKKKQKTSPNKNANPEGSDEDAESTSNLQLAWEVLELAKAIFTKKAETTTGQTKTDAEARASEAVQWLGEVCMEGEEWSQAVEEFTQCLAGRKARLPGHSRSIAESAYTLGMALAHLGMYAEAEANLDCAVAVLHKRIAKLQEIGTSMNICQEIEEIENAINDILEKKCEHKEAAFAEVTALKNQASGRSLARKPALVGHQVNLHNTKVVASITSGTA